MKKKLYTILAVLMIVMLTASPAFARGAIKLSGTLGLGSITYTGSIVVGYYGDVTVKLTAMGYPVTICTNQGGNEAPGQNPPKVTVTGEDEISNDDIAKNGKSSVGIEAGSPLPWYLPGTQGGCPNDNWTARVENVLWTDAQLDVYDGTSENPGPLLLTQVYKCYPELQTETSISCELISETSYYKN